MSGAWLWSNGGRPTGGGP
ncbi:Aquaporin PIP2-1 [Zea mays]|nr:Aquaporin PIP2-1 [Zea mays]